MAIGASARRIQRAEWYCHRLQLTGSSLSRRQGQGNGTARGWWRHFSSEDAGKSWNQVLDKDRHIYDVTIDPADPNILYAAGFESSAWRSADRGLHWTRIPGFNFKWAQRVVPDPLDRDKVYITTFGGSVWHGSIGGHEQPMDIATAALDPGQ